MTYLISGALYDMTQSYDPGFWVTGAIIAVSGAMLYFIPCVQRWQENRSGVSRHDYDMGRIVGENRLSEEEDNLA